MYTIEMVGRGDRPWQLVRTYPDGHRKVVLVDITEEEAATVLEALEAVEVAA